MIKGVIIFYLNTDIFDMTEEEVLDKIITINRLFINMMKSDGYTTLFVPTIHEATRVEKINFEEQVNDNP